MTHSGSDQRKKLKKERGKRQWMEYRQDVLGPFLYLIAWLPPVLKPVPLILILISPILLNIFLVKSLVLYIILPVLIVLISIPLSLTPLDSILSDSLSRHQRIRAWENHLFVYEILANPYLRSIPDELYSIRFISGHLDIIDRKSGFLLTFLGLMATVSAVYGKSLFPSFPHHVSLPFKIFSVLWVLTTILCVTGLVWLKWGDLRDKLIPKNSRIPDGATEKRNYRINNQTGSISTSDVLSARDQHRRLLIETVIDRTSMFRASIWLTAITSIFLCVSILPALLNLHPTKPATPPNPLQSIQVPIKQIGPFPSGDGCSTNQNLQAEAKSALSQIEKLKAKKLLIVGSADATPISPRLANEFGNNAGLALTRARCIAGWLTDLLNPLNQHIEMTLTVRDAVQRSAKARKKGSKQDRFVSVYAITNKQ